MNTPLLQVTRSGAAGLAFAAFCFFIVPLIVGSFWLSVFTSTACFALAAAGVAFMYARLGMVSLTQVGLMGVGGWVMLRLNYALAMPFEVNLILAGLITMTLGMILALPALRLRGLYLALVTLMAAGGLEIIFATFRFPNGGGGFWGVKTGTTTSMTRPIFAVSDAGYLRYTIFVATLGFLLIELTRRLTPGRAWAMIRRSEAAAMSAGINVTLYKTVAFALAGLIGGLAGGLLAGSLGLLDGGTFRASESILIFALAVVGGARYWLGVVIAAALFRIVPALLNNWGVDADLSFVIFGAGLLHAVITAPNGIAGQVLDGLSKRASTKLPPLEPSQIDAPTSETVNTTNSTIKVDDITVQFGGVRALDNISVEMSQPISGIIGPNGAGKTTLMNVFSGFITPKAGKITVDGFDLSTLSPHQRSQWGLRRSFQKEEISEDLTVAENVRVQIDTTSMSAFEKNEQVARALAYVGMSSKAQVSGATLNTFERRLTDIAKCIVGAPKLIMFDEPAGGLSVQETQALGNLILGIHNHTGAHVLLIDHDVDLIARICAETLVIDFGVPIAFGTTADVLADPKVKAAYLGTEEITA
ncbi:branched-chain amino acid ABC transporter ATP-binding protein/permease [Planktotalea sp.]|uniref:branched-chain amino acid ABC transporter ATP-binding protein/permease n=1 Tax=Planktotalea sp. TaxID=2029877 RepID=UPI003D6C1B83